MLQLELVLKYFGEAQQLKSEEITLCSIDHKLVAIYGPVIFAQMLRIRGYRGDLFTTSAS